MREAEDVPLPGEEAFGRVRASLMAEKPWEAAAGARVVEVHPAPAAHADSFWHWAKSLLAGGGWGANVVRLAAVGGVAFAMGGNWFQAAPHQQVPVAGPVAPVPAPAPAREIVAPSYWASIVETSSIAPDHVAVPEDTVEVALRAWELAPASQGFTLDRSPYGARSASTSPGSWERPAPAYANPSSERVLDLLQQLRFELLVRGDDGLLASLRELEGTLDPLLGDTPATTSAVAGWLAQGEDLRRAGDVDGALEAFGAARAEAAGSFGGFLAQVQIARLLHEDARDYGGALKAYREALAQYPAHFLTPQFKGPLLERVKLLAENSEADWAALGPWEDAQAATGQRRVELLLQTMEAAPRAPLAARAALDAAQAICDDPSLPQDPQAMLARINEALRVSEDAPDAATMQFAMGLVAHQRLANRPLAQIFYTRSLTLPGAQEVAARAEKLVAELRPVFARKEGS